MLFFIGVHTFCFVVTIVTLFWGDVSVWEMPAVIFCGVLWVDVVRRAVRQAKKRFKPCQPDCAPCLWVMEEIRAGRAPEYTL